jgi:hypothetical protein
MMLQRASVLQNDRNQFKQSLKTNPPKKIDISPPTKTVELSFDEREFQVRNQVGVKKYDEAEMSVINTR